ncbi:hypothetical protein Y1Q_0014060 [Alligator mississippiensis]|uniref:Uncharacterized protein n=1 Tax=Alligator mississippiensis TaxID=8496 RepID=A0A151NJY6_ALLMI|nr:hypothetical protein Y1Q_0014060 [Alligator mississippiensis]
MGFPGECRSGGFPEPSKGPVAQGSRDAPKQENVAVNEVPSLVGHWSEEGKQARNSPRCRDEYVMLRHRKRQKGKSFPP